MVKKISMKKYNLAFLLLFVATLTFAQVSPRKQVEGKIGEVTVSVDYGSPSVKGRFIWGNLVKYNAVWRAGANENTTISFDAPVKIDDVTVAAGKYGFFVIASEKEEWTLILSSKNDAWGSSGYSEANDVVRIKVSPTFKAEVQEELVFKVKENGIKLAWDKASILLPIN